MPKVPKDTLYKAVAPRGRPRKIADADEMWTLWEQYKATCDGHTKIQTVIDGTETYNVSVAAPITYTIQGFCLYAGITLTAFERNYQKNPDYEEVVELMRMETETDARGKFEDGSLNPRLAGLWMSRYKGYSTKQETEIKGGVPVVLAGEDALED